MNRPSFLHMIIGTGFGLGYTPIAPGTAGAAFALLVWLVMGVYISFPVLQIITSLLIFIFFVLGVWSGTVLEKYWGNDPSRVVVDEMVGTWISLLAVPYYGYLYSFLAFFLFRIFDIFKPLGVRKMERLGGGLAIMMDDVLAGIYGAFSVMLIAFVVSLL